MKEIKELKPLDDKDFIKWLDKYKIDYKSKSKDYLLALYGEYTIEINKKMV